jgi:hypothetical protein
MKEAEMNRIVTSADIEAYNRDGVTVLRQIVNADWRAQLAAAIERDMAQSGPFYHGYESEDGGRFHGNLRLWESDATMREFCLHSPLPALAQQFFHSTKVNLLYDQLFVKEAASLKLRGARGGNAMTVIQNRPLPPPEFPSARL